MKLNFRLSFWSCLFLMPVLIVSACAPAAQADLADDFLTLPTASPTPTPAEFPVALQPTSPAQAAVQARLAVLTALAKLLRNGGGQTAIQQAQSADLRAGDGVELVTLDGQVQQSYGILYVPDLANVELFANTKIFLAGVKQDANGSAEVTLDLEAGGMFVHLNEERAVRVIVRTPYATITSLTSGAEFDVCRSEELTCVMVKRGVVEIAAKGRREIVRAGSAGVVLNDRPMSPAICAPAGTFLAWEEDYRLFASTPSLQQEIAALPQEPCPLGSNGFPLHARILYQDEFSDANGWDQGMINRFAVRYARYPGARYYQVDVKGPEDQYLAFVPNDRGYEDVNIDVKTRVEAAGKGDFRYGMVFRRSGDQYYAFVISPATKTWYFLKSSSAGLEVLKYGVDQRMRGLAGQDVLRAESYGSVFLVSINNRFLDWVSDAEYARGEAGLFVESINNLDARINFNSITIWDMPVPVPAQGEICFNASDDDGNGWIDQADPSCQRIDEVLTSPTIVASPTRTPRATKTPRATRTPKPPVPTATKPPATQPPLPTLVPPLPTLVPPLPTLIPPLLTILPPVLTLLPPLPTIDLSLPGMPPVGTPTPE